MSFYAPEHVALLESADGLLIDHFPIKYIGRTANP